MVVLAVHPASRDGDAAQRQVVHRHGTLLPDGQPALLPFDTAEDDHVLLGIEAGIELVARRRGRERRGNAHPIERSATISFAPFCLDLAAGKLLCAGRTVGLRPKTWASFWICLRENPRCWRIRWAGSGVT